MDVHEINPSNPTVQLLKEFKKRCKSAS
jgi:hypothetical protein